MCLYGESDDSSQTNSSFEFWIIILRLGFGVYGLGFYDFGLGTSFGDELSRIRLYVLTLN